MAFSKWEQKAEIERIDTKRFYIKSTVYDRTEPLIVYRW